VINSFMINNNAIGWGANPARAGTPGGGSGSAIYTDDDNYNVVIAGTIIHGNNAREGGAAGDAHLTTLPIIRQGGRRGTYLWGVPGAMGRCLCGACSGDRGEGGRCARKLFPAGNRSAGCQPREICR
jgi:hypothetical protein